MANQLLAKTVRGVIDACIVWGLSLDNKFTLCTLSYQKDVDNDLTEFMNKWEYSVYACIMSSKIIWTIKSHLMIEFKCQCH